MQGITVGGLWAKSKKAIRETLAAGDADLVDLVATSMFGDEYGGPITGMPVNRETLFVGPDPYTRRNFYGSITRKDDGTFVIK